MDIKKQKFIEAFKRLDDFERNHKPNMALLDTFPNGLLIESSMINKSRKNKPIERKNEPQENDNDNDVWNILNKMKREHESESLENLTETDDIDEVDKFSKCTSCNKVGTLIEDCHDGVVVCLNCGMVNNKLVDYGAEWRSYNNDDNRGEGMNRCGCPTNFFFPKSSQGTIVVGTRNSRLRRKQTWIGTVYKERSLSQVFNYITKICVKNNISKIIIDTAKTLYQKISNCKYKGGKNDGKQIIIRGDNRKSVIANCVHKACE